MVVAFRQFLAQRYWSETGLRDGGATRDDVLYIRGGYGAGCRPVGQCGQRQAKMAPVMRPKAMPSMKLAMMVRLYAPNQRALGMNENE